MLRVLIVDDERLARASIKRLLLSEEDLEIVGEAENINEAIREINTKNPNLVFMDIELSSSNGFEIFDQLESIPVVVFVTAYAEHAVRAFSVNATDYLLKPVSQSRITETLGRVRKKLFTGAKQELIESQTIELKVPGRSVVVLTNEIAALKANGDFTHIILVNQPELMICRTLVSIERALSNPNFLRVGRSIIINLTHVRGITTDRASGSLVKLSGIDHYIKLGATSTSRLRKALSMTVDRQL